jgi:hypothetical protein
MFIALPWSAAEPLERNKTMKNRRLWSWLGGVLLISAAFLLLNFRLAMSSTQAEKLVATTDSGEDLSTPMQGNDRISMVLVGEGPLVRALGKALTEKMNEAGIGDVELVQGLEPANRRPVLVVKVGKPGPIWTPFFAMSEVPIHAGYASNGEMAFMEIIEETHMSVGSPDHSVLTMYGEYAVKDRSLGLISRPGYHHYLADYLAKEIVTALKDLYSA